METWLEYLKKYAVAFIAFVVGLFIFIVFSLVSAFIGDGGKFCQVDSDCVVYGETGDCRCGCYNQNDLPWWSKDNCFCIVPQSCHCVNNECEGE